MLLYTSVIMFAVINIAVCDYKCLCNYNTEKTVYSSPSTDAQVLGYMYEFDCKAVSGSSREDGWLVIAFEHKLGYVEDDAQLQVQACPGSIPDEDKLVKQTTAQIQTTTSNSPSILHNTTSKYQSTVQITTSNTPPILQNTTSNYQSTVQIIASNSPSIPQNTTSNYQSTVQIIASNSPSIPQNTNSNYQSTVQNTTSNSQSVLQNTTSNSQVTVHTETSILTTNAISNLQHISPSSVDINTKHPTSSAISSTDNASSTVSMTMPITSHITDASIVSEKNILNTTTVNPFIYLTSAKTPVPTTDVVSSTTSSVQQTATGMQTVMTTSRSIEGRIGLCPISIQLQANGDTGIKLAQFGNKCYEILQRKVPWTQAENSCQTNKGHLVDITNQQEQDFLYNFLTNIRSHTVWLGLHDRNAEENFVWTSGSPVTYTYWKADRKDLFYHQKQDCVYMTVNGTWDNINCGNDNLPYYYRHAYVCQYATDSPLDVNKCPHILQIQATKDNGILSQYKDSCYELVPNVSVAWQHAADVCNKRGGHLVYIKSAEEQAFILGFMLRHSPNKSVWIGLTDSGSEGHFHWTSGENARYTNWIPNHTNNEQEDCVVLLPHKNGLWDDIGCGSSHPYVSGITDAGENHPLLCQYHTVNGAQIVG